MKPKRKEFREPDELRPCRCGRRDFITFTIVNRGAFMGPDVGLIQCTDCGQAEAFVFHFHGQQDQKAAEAWNRINKPPTLLSRLLRAAKGKANG